MEDIVCSAPGKLVLFGEHAVVYDRPCIVTAVDQRVYVAVGANGGDEIEIGSSTTDQAFNVPVNYLFENVSYYPKDFSFVMAAVERFFKTYNIHKGIKIRTQGLKNSFGLGSSSSVTVATLKALGEYFGKHLSQREIFDMAYQSVLDVQGKGSGCDIAAAIYGGTLYFLAGGKIIEPLKMERFPLIIGYSGKKASTVNLVDEVQLSLHELPTIINNVFDTIQLIVEAAKQKILNEQWNAVGQLANINQGLLDSLGVSTASLAGIIFAARQAGALGAKISGAGGGDCMFAIINGDADKVESAMLAAGAQIIDSAINAAGVRLERGIPDILHV